MVEDLARRLGLVGLDLREAHAADRMLFEMTRDGRLAAFHHPEARFGLKFIEEALALRLMLSVGRTLQGTSKDKASFAQLLTLIKALDPNIKLLRFEKRLEEMKNGQAARKLQKCRNGFLAHTLVGELGARDGMDLSPVSNLLYDLTSLYEEIHVAMTGTEDRMVGRDLEIWRGRAHETWDALLGAVDDDEDLVA
jgi:hypothetical protein